MKVVEIAFSCYPVTDIPRAKVFYEGILGLQVSMDSDMGEQGRWIEYNIGSGTFAIGKCPGWIPSPDGCAVALEVEDFEAAVAKLKDANVPVKMGPLETPVCQMIMVNDPDGSTLIIHRRKSSSPCGCGTC